MIENKQIKNWIDFCMCLLTITFRVFHGKLKMKTNILLKWAISLRLSRQIRIKNNRLPDPAGGYPQQFHKLFLKIENKRRNQNYFQI